MDSETNFTMIGARAADAAVRLRLVRFPWGNMTPRAILSESPDRIIGRTNSRIKPIHHEGGVCTEYSVILTRKNAAVYGFERVTFE